MQMRKKLLHMMCIFLTCILLAPAIPLKILMYLLAGIIVSAVVFWKYDKLEWKQYIHKESFLIDLTMTIMFCNDFYNRWLPSSKVSIIAGICHLNVKTFLIIVSAVLGIMAISFIDIVLWTGKKYIGKILRKGFARNIFSICFVIFFQYIVLQYSVVQSVHGMINPGFSMILYNVLIIFILNLIILLAVRKWKIALTVTSIVFGIWSVANYYVILFHGTPLYLSELRNAKTAFAVAGTYTYSISGTVIVSAAILVMQLNFIKSYIKFDGKGFQVKRLLQRVGITFLVITCVFIYTHCSGILNKNEWNWNVGVMEDGFVASTLINAQNSFNPISEPEGYELSKIFTDGGVSSTNQKEEEENQRPDVILILNETFYDLSYYTDITTDMDYMEDFYSVSNAVYGHAIVPNVGGGTNNSEFEYLYSKSMYLLAGDAPFSYLSRNLEERSVVKYLDSLGYTTTGMHCGGEQNYQRHIAYPTIGFDHIFLGPDAFSYISSNGNRSWKDEDNYKDLIDYYESADENPQFIYMLTYQNHGGYEQNEDSMDTVHVSDDLGDLTDDVNEYLSSVKLSGEAFKELTEYYEKVDRDVIICMVGDHAPSFITKLTAKSENLIDEDTINMRSVPYVLWSNFDADFSMYTDYASMVDLVPMVLQGAGLPLSTFYENILELHEILPIRTSDGKAVDKEMEVQEYSLEDANELWSQYYWLEYNSLLETEEYKEELFKAN